MGGLRLARPAGRMGSPRVVAAADGCRCGGRTVGACRGGGCGGVGGCRGAVVVDAAVVGECPGWWCRVLRGPLMVGWRSGWGDWSPGRHLDLVGHGRHGRHVGFHLGGCRGGECGWRIGDASWTGLVVPSLPGPAVPTLLSPTSGQQVAAGSAIPLSWVHNSTVGGVQTAYRVQVRAVGAGSWSYVAADGTLSGTVQTVTSAVGAASINAGLLTAGTSHEWTVSTQEAGVWSATARWERSCRSRARPCRR